MHAPQLPDPVLIANVFGRTQGQTGRWLIEHDGREYLTTRNLDTIRGAGAAWSDRYAFRQEVYPVVPTLIYSGKISDTLREHQVRFAAPPIYLYNLIT